MAHIVNSFSLSDKVSCVLLTLHFQSPIIGSARKSIRKAMVRMGVMNHELELDRLTKELDNFKKIIEVQQNTINRLIDYFILGEKKER